MLGSTATLSDALLAEGPIHNFQASAVTLASDPVSNISLLSGLQSLLESTEAGEQQLQMVATYAGSVLSSTVTCCKGTKLRLDGDALHAMVANAHDKCHSSHHEIAEQNRVGLAVLLLGVWADKLPARIELAYAKVPEAGEDVDCSSDQLATNDSSAVRAVINAVPAAAAAAEAVNAPSSSGTPASASASASKSANHAVVPPQSPCSASVVAASQPLPCSADHMTMMASDLDEEDEEKRHEWVPDSCSQSLQPHVSSIVSLCHY